MTLSHSNEQAGVPPTLRLEERIYYDLLARIQSGDYPQGTRLPTEHDLAAEFGVSRPVIRAALARLREAELIVSRQGAGSFVSASGIDHSRGFDALGSIEDIAAYYNFRRLLECEAAATAAGRCSDAQIGELTDLLDRIDADIGAGQATIEHDIRFHSRLAQIAGNRFVVESLRMLQPHMLFVAKFVRSLTPSGYAIGKQSMQTEHRGIADAVRARDPDAARRAMRDHINSSEIRIFRGAGNAD